MQLSDSIFMGYSLGVPFLEQVINRPVETITSAELDGKVPAAVEIQLFNKDLGKTPQLWLLV